MARRKRQSKPKGQVPEQRAINATDDLVAISGDTQYIISAGGISIGAGTNLSAKDVAGYPPVSQCLQMIAGDCARLPIQVKDRMENGLDFRPVPATHYAQSLIDPWGRPNDEETQFDLFYDWYFDALLWGGGFLWIDRIGPMPRALYRLLPDRTWRIDRGGRVYFVTHVWDDTANEWRKQVLFNEDVLYLEGVRISEESTSPIALYRKTFKAALAGVDWTARYFSQGTQAGGILMVPPGANSKAVDNVEEMIRARSNPDNWFRSLVLKDGFKWQSTTADLKNANSVELDEQSARAVARIYNIPPSKLGIRDSMSYNSRESDRQEYLDSCLSSWLIQGRSQIHRKLILPSEQPRVIVDYVVDELALLNMDARSNLVNKAIENDWMDVDEARRIMKLPPLTEQQRAALTAKRQAASATSATSAAVAIPSTDRINGHALMN